ncbi:hypothetical protein GR927_10795 [Mycolicibacterium sp. 3033]|nr:hypothetical protein [Mycolicibacterium aurantiacum]
MNRVILGGEAVRAGVATRHELRRDYTTLYRGVFVRRGVEVTLRDRAVGAWLATGRKGAIAGVAAAGLHGAPWVDVDVPVDVMGVKCRPREGIVVHTDVLTADQITRVGGLPVTTRVRTAFDLGRQLERTEALQRLDALMWNQRFDTAEVVELADRSPRVQGIAQLRELLPLIDGGAASPRESALRLALHDNGFPRPETQYPVLDGSRPLAFLDLAYPEYGVAVEYDGDHHRKDRTTYVKDIARLRMLEQRGWIVVRVIAEDRPAAWLSRAATALRERGCPLMPAPLTTLSA